MLGYLYFKRNVRRVTGLALLYFATITTGCVKPAGVIPAPVTEAAKEVVTTPITVPVKAKTLQSAAIFPIGTAIEPSKMFGNSNYKAVVAAEFSSITPESAMKFDRMHWGLNNYDFSAGDSVVAYARQYGQRVHGHTLIWSRALPYWVLNFKGDSAAWENLFKAHILTMATHYRGKVASWDVVNEALKDNDGSLINKDAVAGDGSGSVWRQHLGPDYIARAFIYARQADPNALLFYNDYGDGPGGTWSEKKLNAMISLVTNLKKRGVPIAGVGIQMHINIFANNNSITDALKRVAATGLLVHISELDIATNPNYEANTASNTYLLKLQSDKFQFIAQTYKATVPVLQRFGITTWGFSDADSWIPVVFRRVDQPLLFDASYKKKPAYDGYINGLNN